MAALKELFIPLSRNELDGLLEEWSWQTEGRFQPIALTAFGDWFLRADEGGLFFLDSGDGTLERIGDGREGLDQALADPEHRQTLLLERQFDLLVEAGTTLEDGMCYSWKLAPCMGGGVEVENLEPASIDAHQADMSTISRRVQSLPLGVRVGEVLVDCDDEGAATSGDPIAQIAYGVLALLLVPLLVVVKLALSGQL